MGMSVVFYAASSAAQPPPPQGGPAPLWTPGAAQPQPQPQPAPQPQPQALPAPQAQAQVAAPVALPPAPAARPAPAAAAAAAEDEGAHDQERFVGHLGVTYFGVSEVPLFGQAARNAPVIGIRYWLGQSIGLDLGLGVSLTSASVDCTNITFQGCVPPGGGGTTTVDNPSVFAGAVHGGVPIVLGRGKHYAFEITPEATVGFATATIKSTNPGTSDTSISGSRIQLGARVGGEVFFGFIGVPELALQASVGLALRRDATKASSDNPSASAGTSQMAIGTTVEGAPWAIFVNNISAIYYF
jgi:hypothetical protein